MHLRMSSYFSVLSPHFLPGEDFVVPCAVAVAVAVAAVVALAAAV